jgi:hypothetical protein
VLNQLGIGTTLTLFNDGIIGEYTVSNCTLFLIIFFIPCIVWNGMGHSNMCSLSKSSLSARHTLSSQPYGTKVPVLNETSCIRFWFLSYVEYRNKLSWISSSHGVSIKIFWVVTTYILERARRFGRTYLRYLQIPRISQEINRKNATSWAQFASCFCWCLAWLTLQPRRWRRYFPPKRLTLHELHGDPTQETVLFRI